MRQNIWCIQSFSVRFLQCASEITADTHSDIFTHQSSVTLNIRDGDGRSLLFEFCVHFIHVCVRFLKVYEPPGMVEAM